ncbi:hypothetical protein M413DRAFT_448081 [Hebeloma cylindrosporum]|uniref:Uncharacterized protein n=1 Tax=Hebeloma cylindrosporum TaxID=76867 RepID=A0A0C3C355_HEBCY|nr:hypothetical protein M413DRAFT_448081 [Hebeloma cylindrosporum h7]
MRTGRVTSQEGLPSGLLFAIQFSESTYSKLEYAEDPERLLEQESFLSQSCITFGWRATFDGMTDPILSP